MRIWNRVVQDLSSYHNLRTRNTFEFEALRLASVCDGSFSLPSAVASC